MTSIWYTAKYIWWKL